MPEDVFKQYRDYHPTKQECLQREAKSQNENLTEVGKLWNFHGDMAKKAMNHGQAYIRNQDEALAMELTAQRVANTVNKIGSLKQKVDWSNWKWISDLVFLGSAKGLTAQQALHGIAAMGMSDNMPKILETAQK